MRTIEVASKDIPQEFDGKKIVFAADFQLDTYFEEMTKEQKERADMTLAGHTHGGQITLFGLILHAEIKHPWKYGYGLKEYDGHKIYTTSGVGGGAFEMFIRFFAQPEIVVLKLRKAK